LPKNESRLHPEAKKLVRNYLKADNFESAAERQGIGKKNIFFNLVPLTLNAGVAIYPYIKDHVSPDSTESKSFLNIFKLVGEAVTEVHDYKILKFSLPD
jgi:hypothetical protein